MDFSTPFGQEVLRIGNLTDSLNRSHQTATALEDIRYKETLKAIIKQSKAMLEMLPAATLPVTETEEVKVVEVPVITEEIKKPVVVEEPLIVRNVGGDPFAVDNNPEGKSLLERLREKNEEKKNKETLG